MWHKHDFPVVRHKPQQTQNSRQRQIPLSLFYTQGRQFEPNCPEW